MTERCENCRFWAAGFVVDINGEEREHPGQCRRHAPAAYKTENKVPTGQGNWFYTVCGEVPFPLMMANDWCGEWEDRRVDGGQRADNYKDQGPPHLAGA